MRLHIHFWHFESEMRLSREVKRRDGTRLFIDLLFARFLCHCGGSKLVSTDRSVRDGIFEVVDD